MRCTKIMLAGVVGLMLGAVAPSAVAVPLDVYSMDGPQDPLLIEGQVHELGDQPPFPTNEWLESSWTFTEETSCFDGSDDPTIPNVEVTITNRTDTYWQDLHYVADPDTTITNFDGWIGNAGFSDAEEAFVIDWVGINRPLIFESMGVNTVFEPGETWQFIIQDFGNALGGPPAPFDSIGIAGLSAGWMPSTGSIIAVIPEPASLCLLAVGSLLAIRRRR